MTDPPSKEAPKVRPMSSLKTCRFCQRRFAEYLWQSAFGDSPDYSLAPADFDACEDCQPGSMPRGRKGCDGHR